MSLTTTTTLHNGVEIPVFGLGVYKIPEQEVYDSVTSALALGYRHIDTASFYENEEGVGKAIKDSDIPRNDIFVTTKVWNDEQGYDETLQAFERSLKRLEFDYVDLYLIHWPVPGKYKETWKALEKLYKDGKVRAIGVSNFLPHHLESLMEDAEIKPMANQIELHPQLTQVETRNYCKQHNIKVEAWSPLGRANYLDDPILNEIANKHNKTPAQVILRWNVQSEIITIPKSVNTLRQKENADVFDFELTNEEVQKIDSININKRIGQHPDHFKY
ncbi:aldo/keto reductase [Aquibacillus sp. 3ASR75-11]|uniref:Aldo/keto reductase n=1 Tax=Terrihalobacillus insolitus TaxID=2950438 RepID=A0A9X3WWK0_9BACI|nr:aldo/keto reductase [Terrihalobacillus insolitus]MDC3413604.1 aldo/keto reductase [Terrihalobacillus insolitus]MDC3424639.1 aldo/keto reductase [Terrihalobacillus insolitus]